MGFQSSHRQSASASQVKNGIEQTDQCQLVFRATEGFLESKVIDGANTDQHDDASTLKEKNHVLSAGT